MLVKNIKKLKKQIKNIPQEPGVYVFYDDSEGVLYIGKASKLKSRLKSYVDMNILDKNPKTKRLISQTSEIKYFLVKTEVEALVLEAQLIKKYRPEYNVDLKDDKFYKYIEIKKKKDGSYKVGTSRKKEGVGSFFGPFPSGKAINVVLRDIRKLFPYRSCTQSKFERYKKLGRPCLYGHLNLCPAPCQSKEAEEINNENVEKIKRFLRGEYKGLVKDFQKKMKKASENLNYEDAAEMRDKIEYYEYLSRKYKDSQELLKDIGELEKAGTHLKKLIKILSFYFPEYDNYLNKPIERLENFKIEFYDVSNLGDTQIVGSMITLEGERFNKSLYRRFKIRRQKTQDDFKAMQEIVSRRVNHLKDWGRPDLIVIDGGKGQLSSVLEVLEDYDIPVISLAKRSETIYLKPKRNKPKNKEFSQIDLPDSDPALKILIKGRDEVHRFGLNYNKKLREIG